MLSVRVELFCLMPSLINFPHEPLKQIRRVNDYPIIQVIYIKWV